MYSSKEPLDTILNYALCVTVDISLSEDAPDFDTSNIVSLDVGLAFSVNSPSRQQQQLDGTAVNNRTLISPAVFSLHINRQQLTIYVLAFDPSGSQLFILARDMKDYHQFYDKTVMHIASELGFSNENNKPIAIAQPQQCIYTEADD
eukprot:gene24569-30933_t